MTSTISHAELLAMGHSPHDITALCDSGELTRLRHSMYSAERLDDELTRHRTLIRATTRLVDPTSVVSHTSAAVLHGLPVQRSSLDRVTMTRLTPGHGDKSPQLLVRNTRIIEAEIGEVDDVRVTGLARTVCDVARTEPLGWGISAADAALAAGISRSELGAALAMHPRLHGLRRARRVLRFADARSESPAESISRINMSIAGLPTPELQTELFDADGEFVARADFFWRDYGVVGEVDGAIKYGALLRPGQKPEQAIMNEKRREGGIRGLGLWLVRWDWEVANSPQELKRIVGRALELGARQNAKNLPDPAGFPKVGRSA
ncbi:hypothetical protein [Tessaracoccus oleiagri]|uniref:Transcriptional regulator, AbiEi antitoxin, Type IV TA system n=1 Tax=Tessaracoccus oleiagri TaxID=686624 RepID=A0A1G9I5B0_9ACTN|nr:hypothetical protein [Tessaracoccus oleiagri]SDL20054.1 Transcriptional regulator, AbiEi antitoxin, Type IV TA system [Tessaracoccus oleiagri]